MKKSLLRVVLFAVFVLGLQGAFGQGVTTSGMNGRVMGTQGNRVPDMAPHGNYPCAGEDKWVSIAVNNEQEWRNLCRTMGDPEWSHDSRYADKKSRLQNQDELDRRLGEWTSTRTHYEVTELLQSAGVAAAPCLDVEERYFDPQFQERKTGLDFWHPATETDVIPGVPFKMSKTECEVRKPAPMMGEDNEYVFLKILSISQEEIDKLIADRVIH